MTDIQESTPAIRRPRKMAREPQVDSSIVVDMEMAVEVEPKLTKANSKAALVLELLQRSEGATPDDLVAATGWLPHTVRAALTGLRKKGHAVVRTRVDGATRYAIAAAPAQ
jgi:transcription initiation factor IIE alpha subunit